MDEQPAHCDDVAFLVIVTKHTRRALVHVSAQDPNVILASGIKEQKLGPGFQKNRTELSRECVDWILSFLGGHEFPAVMKTTCSQPEKENDK